MDRTGGPKEWYIPSPPPRLHVRYDSNSRPFACECVVVALKAHAGVEVWMFKRESADIKSNSNVKRVKKHELSLVELCSEGHVRVASHQLLQKLKEKCGRRLRERICVLSLRGDVFQLD